MKIGPLDRRIEIQAKTITPDPVYGTDVVTWATVATRSANLQDEMPSRGGDESVAGGALEVSKKRTRIRIRWYAALTSAHRIKFGTRILHIIAGPAEIGGRRHYMEIMAEDISTDG